MRFLFFFIVSILFVSCRLKNDPNQDKYIFKMLSSTETGIDHVFGSLPHSSLEGGGVGVGDFDLDGNLDVFLIGDSIHGLYKNTGAMKFENRIDDSGIPSMRGAGAVTIYDINNDNLPDIIIGRRSVSNNPLQKIINGNLELEKLPSNLIIYLNQGNFAFKESKKYQIKIDEPVGGMGVGDFDNNGLLDFVVSSWNVTLDMFDGVMLDFEKDFAKKSNCSTQIYLQTSPGVFLENCKTSNLSPGGKVKTSFSNITTDLNHDGKTDIVLTNDFDFPDSWYLNKGGGIFEDQQANILSMPFFSMGVDAADMNNDALLDLFITDMRPEGYFRQKTVKYDKFFNWNSLDSKGSLNKQQVRNHFYVNRGKMEFTEIAEMVEMDASEWSWSVLLADFDNNQYKDVFISNGYFMQSMMRHDSPFYIDSVSSFIEPDKRALYFFGDTITKEYYKNYFFSNQGGLEFENSSQNWFMAKALNTRGAAYADLDNDGDLDLILNNAKQQSCILQNTSTEKKAANYLRVLLKANNFEPIHSKCYIYYNDKIQLNEYNPVRGFYSSSEPFLHFGLGSQNKIDSLIVEWSNGLKSKIISPPINQVLTIDFNSLKPKKESIKKCIKSAFFEENLALDYVHQENYYNDFKQNLLLPQNLSRFGPDLALGDLSGNGLEDIVIGGSMGCPATVYYQHSGGVYRIDSNCFEAEKGIEDAGVIIYDINEDGYNDVFIAAGGNEKPEHDSVYYHRFYLSDGAGKFTRHFVPSFTSSASVVRKIKIADKTYLLIAGRIRPWLYPLSPTTYILEFQNGKFIDKTSQIAPGLKNIGMVTDVLCTDLNQDNKEDLIFVGDYMSPTTFLNSGIFLEKVEWLSDLKEYSGLWNCIEEGDFNGDGMPDFILGNLGENTRYKASFTYPLKIYANDFDDNGSLDVITGYYDSEKLYPTKHLNTLKSRINGFSKTYYKTDVFAQKTINEIFPPHMLAQSFQAEAKITSSICLISEGDGAYAIKKLPFWAQVSNIADVVAYDINNDGFDDLVLAGNYYHAEIERGFYNGHKGLILMGSKTGTFSYLFPKDSGMWLLGEVRKLAILNRETKPLLLALKNNERSVCFNLKNK